jgi:light-regulated signal transduction histidine kinase (bacteriophytochrome)
MTDAQRIATLEAQLAALRGEMQAFTHTVSHDLRAPLRHIVSYAQLVQEDAGPLLNAEVQGFLATMTDSARHMGCMLDGLGALSQLGTATVTLAPVPLNALVAEVVAVLARQHPGRTIDWRIAPDLPTVQADAALLRQALQQVLGNALKFTAPSAAAVVDIHTVANERPGFATLQVRDNGVGYNPAQQAALFTVFGRLHTVKQFDGIGMGLVLCRKALARMGASVDTLSSLVGGCTATLQLPLA